MDLINCYPPICSNLQHNPRNMQLVRKKGNILWKCRGKVRGGKGRRCGISVSPFVSGPLFKRWFGRKRSVFSKTRIRDLFGIMMAFSRKQQDKDMKMEIDGCKSQRTIHGVVTKFREDINELNKVQAIRIGGSIDHHSEFFLFFSVYIYCV